jgi:hypothetical protein
MEKNSLREFENIRLHLGFIGHLDVDTLIFLADLRNFLRLGKHIIFGGAGENNHQVGGALLYRPVDADFFRHLDNNIPFKELDGQRRGAAAQDFRNGIDGIVAVVKGNDQRGAGFRFGIKAEGNFSDDAQQSRSC